MAERFVALVLEAGLAKAYKIAVPDETAAGLVVFVEGRDTAYFWRGFGPCLQPYRRKLILAVLGDLFSSVL